jgi:hypothetical protein
VRITAMELVVLLIISLPFRIFWWAFKHDFGLLEESPVTRNKVFAIRHPSSPQSLWDRELDGPELGHADGLVREKGSSQNI